MRKLRWGGGYDSYTMSTKLCAIFGWRSHNQRIRSKCTQCHITSACSQKLLLLIFVSTILHFLVPLSNPLLSIPYVLITHAVHRGKMHFIKLRSLHHIEGYTGTHATQKGNNLLGFHKKIKMLWLRNYHEQISSLSGPATICFELCCTIRKHQFFPKTIQKHY